VVLDDGFSWQGTRYRSLSAIARKITGTAWSEPLFFRLKPSQSEGRSLKMPDPALVAACGENIPGFLTEIDSD
jgi:hypothetical protein